ncbi:hypothetical protein Vafri_8583 [Volvox africanus]|uniref:Uncharacterized protein n=1 Tax=Volvox africanus TaxID=51714 RepID=A0A8J4B756_9CHLO|nr:hypothetical protein Vafri_8583 [Volvox africanus]
MYSKTGPEGAEGFGPYSTVTVSVPEQLRRGAGGASQGQMVTARLRIPHARGEWPSERGGYPFSLQLGPLATHVVEIFREAGGGAAPFPDPWDTASAAAADAVQPENFAYFPPWIANTHSFGPENSGNDGWYNDHLTGEVPAAISHLHAGLTSGDFTKIVHFAVEVPYGWDFDVALRVAPQTAPYLGTEVHGRVPPLLAMAPGVVHGGLTQGDFAAMMQVPVCVCNAPSGWKFGYVCLFVVQGVQRRGKMGLWIHLTKCVKYYNGQNEETKYCMNCPASGRTELIVIFTALFERSPT